MKKKITCINSKFQTSLIIDFVKTICHLFITVRTSFDLNPKQEWTQAQKVRTINL